MSVLKVREAAMSCVMVPDAPGRQYCTISCMKNMKNCERYRDIFTPRALTSKENPLCLFCP